MTDYNTDFALWALDQAARWRAGAAEIDRDNIAEELETLARALHRELGSALPGLSSRCCNGLCSKAIGSRAGIWRSRKSAT